MADEAREELLAGQRQVAGDEAAPADSNGEDNGTDGLQGDARTKDCWGATKHVAEVLILFVALFYVDMGLDAMSIWSMWSTDNPKLAGLNVMGIVTAALLGIVSIIQSASRSFKENDGQMITMGVLYPFQLHVLYLGYVSIRDMRLHPFLTQVKMMEATFEAAVSANVQAYFVVWSDLDVEQRMWLLASILSSVVCLAFGYAAFDVRTKGFDGVAGTAVYFSLRFLLVLVFRTCEVLVRVCGLALFNRACRPYGAVIEVGIEGMVWLVAIHLYGGWHFHAFPSVFVYMNPLLERSNAGSVPCRFYYAVRLTSLIAMLAAAVYWRGDELPELFADDYDFIVALIAASAGMAVLLPVLRYQATDSLMLYEEEQWSRKAFTSAERRLRDGMAEAMQAQCVGPLEKQVPIVEELLRQFGDKEVIAADPAFKEKARKLLVTASNCPASAAPVQLQERLCDVLVQLADRVPVVQEEVVELGALELALQLGKAGSARLRGTALRLAALAAERGLLPRAELASVGAVELAQSVLDSEGTMDEGEGMQAVAVLLASGSGKGLQEIVDAAMPADGEELSHPQRIGAAVAYSLAYESSALEPKVLKRLLDTCGECPFKWKEQQQEEEAGMPKPYRVPDGVPSAYDMLGGLCVRALLEQRRKGVDGVEELITGTGRVEEWRWHLRNTDEYLEDLCHEIQKRGPRGNYGKEAFEEEFEQVGCSLRMDEEFQRRFAKGVVNKRYVINAAQAMIRSGCAEALAQECSTVEPNETHLFMLRRLVARVILVLGNESPLSVEVAVTACKDDLLRVLPTLVQSMNKNIKETAEVLTYKLCSIEALGLQMEKILEQLLKPGANISPRVVAFIGSSLCLSDRLSRLARHTGLLEMMMERACDTNLALTSIYDATSIVVALLDGSNSKDIQKITEQEKAMSSLISSLQGRTESRNNEPWEPLQPMFRLCAFSEGRAALIKHGAVPRLRAWIAKELLQVIKGTREPKRLRALNYAMEALLYLVSTSVDAVEVIIKEEVKMQLNDEDTLVNMSESHYYCWKAGGGGTSIYHCAPSHGRGQCESCRRFEAAGAPAVDDRFHSSIEAVRKAEDLDLPWLYKQATELQLYWAGRA